ncbi:MAG TPA: hypothetical protein VK425_11355 [Acidimicrobiales bacterium]|nr:hypothetical protein [Acidimicrobiales bacterium]
MPWPWPPWSTAWSTTHAEVFVLQGDSYRLKDRAKEVVASS